MSILFLVSAISPPPLMQKVSCPLESCFPQSPCSKNSQVLCTQLRKGTQFQRWQFKETFQQCLLKIIITELQKPAISRLFIYFGHLIFFKQQLFFSENNFASAFPKGSLKETSSNNLMEIRKQSSRIKLDVFPEIERVGAKILDCIYLFRLYAEDKAF